MRAFFISMIFLQNSLRKLTDIFSLMKVYLKHNNKKTINQTILFEQESLDIYIFYPYHNEG